jgi:hypothetical protein
MTVNILRASRSAIAGLALAALIGGTAQAQYGGGYGPGPGYGYGPGPGYGSGPSYGPGPGYGPGNYPSGSALGLINLDLYHALCEGNTAGFGSWQVDRIARYIKLDDNQQTLLAAVKDAVAKAADATHAGCPDAAPLTWSGELETVQTRLEAVLGAVQLVRPTVDAFFAALSDEQKARLHAVGWGYARYR